MVAHDSLPVVVDVTAERRESNSKYWVSAMAIVAMAALVAVLVIDVQAGPGSSDGETDIARSISD